MFEYILNSWFGNDWLQSIIIAGIVIIVALIVNGIFSMMMSNRQHNVWRSLIIGVVAGIIIASINFGFSGGGGSADEGKEVAGEDTSEEVVNLEATKISLDHIIDEDTSEFSFVIDGQKLDMDNWEEEFTKKLEKYKNLKVIEVKNPKKIPLNHYLSLQEIDKNYENLVFKGLNVE
ncbi:MAG: hypothetical protein ACOCV8_05325 [Spirochaetota bacterium]